MTYLLLFLYNLKFPFALATIVAVILGLWVSARNLEIRDKTDFGSLENKEARYAIMMSLQSCIILFGLTCILWAIPHPDYDVKVIEKKVYVSKPYPVIKWTKGKQIVHEKPVYNKIYDQCLESYDYDVGTDVLKQCHEQALEAMTVYGKLK